MPLNGQLHAFRVYPESRRGLYFIVRVFAGRHRMRQYVRSIGHTASNRTDAMCIPMRGFSKCAGELVFPVALLKERGVTVITHEIAHAALAFAHRRQFASGIIGQQPGRTRSTSMARESSEERFAYVVGDLARQVVKHCYDVGVFV